MHTSIIIHINNISTSHFIGKSTTTNANVFSTISNWNFAQIPIFDFRLWKTEYNFLICGCLEHRSPPLSRKNSLPKLPPLFRYAMIIIVAKLLFRPWSANTTARLRPKTFRFNSFWHDLLCFYSRVDSTITNSSTQFGPDTSTNAAISSYLWFIVMLTEYHLSFELTVFIVKGVISSWKLWIISWSSRN